MVGVGNIGGLVGEMGVAWGMEVVGCVLALSDDRTKTLAAKGIRLIDFAAVLTQADFVSLHVPLSETTRNMFGAKELASMKRGAFLINLARGGIVDEAALGNALASGHLRGAGLDVHAEEGQGRISPLARSPNTILTPHIGASTLDSQRQIGERVVEIVGRFAR
ncbi:MAG: NAD(P)-dependent oxidoreductase [Gammaproteobacteria bacterium]|nr:NAD(P)-dependent oxidoreductase [Gammaproteobacteria bacterium]